jgi:hypothetical protein
MLRDKQDYPNGLGITHMSDARQHDLADTWNLLEGVSDCMEIRQVTLADND